MKILLTIIMVFAFKGFTHAQSAEDSVKSVVNKLFEGMKNADADLVKSVFADSLVFQTIGQDKEGSMIVRNEDPVDFIAFIQKQQKGASDERITFETIRIDGPLASVWTPYHFYYKGQFSHCGVNSFQLVRFKEGWKIQYIIDTRRKQPCDSK